MFEFWRRKQKEKSSNNDGKIPEELSIYDYFLNGMPKIPGKYPFLNGTLIVHKKYFPAYINGKWSIKQECRDKIDCLRDIKYPGCGKITVVTEENLTSAGSNYRTNAMFGFYCKYCNEYHVMREFDIPEDVKDRVFTREHPIESKSKNAKIIVFPKNFRAN